MYRNNVYNMYLRAQWIIKNVKNFNLVIVIGCEMIKYLSSTQLTNKGE